MAESFHPMQGWRRYLFLLELLVLFGPCSLTVLFSLFVIGPSLSLALQKLFGTIEPINDVPWWAAVAPILLSAGALLGVFALGEVARALLQGRNRLAYAPTVIGWMTLSGVAALIGAAAYVVPDAPTHSSAIVHIYLPLIGTVHIVAMSWRRRLFTTNY